MNRLATAETCRITILLLESQNEQKTDRIEKNFVWE